MKKVFYFARDPGGANVIIPIYKESKGRVEQLIYARDFAIQRFMAEGISAIDIERKCQVTEENIYLLLKEINPDVVVTGTSLDDFTERYLWKAAERLAIKSYAILDQWMNLGIRFSKYTYAEEDFYTKCHEHCYLPYKVLVMDQLAKKMLHEDGVEEDRIVVTGQPHFDTVRAKYDEAKSAYDKNYLNVIFVSEPILNDYDGNNEEKLYWGYNEMTIFRSLYECLVGVTATLAKNIRVIIRPHPREDVNKWKKIIRELRCEHIALELDAQNSSFAVLKSADIVCGMSSMFLLEAVICEKPVLSIEIGLCRENPFVLDKLGIVPSILNMEKLSEKLVALLGEKQRNKQMELQEFEFVKNATENIISAIEEEMDR